MSQLMMKAQFSRCGEPIPMRVDKRDYLFQENPHGDFVAIIDSEEHANYLERTGNFERYTPPTYEEMMEREKARAKAEAGITDEPEPEKAEAEKTPAKPTKGKDKGAKAGK